MPCGRARARAGHAAARHRAAVDGAAARPAAAGAAPHGRRGVARRAAAARDAPRGLHEAGATRGRRRQEARRLAGHVTLPARAGAADELLAGRTSRLAGLPRRAEAGGRRRVADGDDARPAVGALAHREGTARTRRARAARRAIARARALARARAIPAGPLARAGEDRAHDHYPRTHPATTRPRAGAVKVRSGQHAPTAPRTPRPAPLPPRAWAATRSRRGRGARTRSRRGSSAPAGRTPPRRGA